MKTSPSEEYIPDLAQAVKDRLEAAWRVYPATANHASSLGHPCARYLTYKRTRWEEEIPPDVALLSIFNEGRLHERAVLQELRDAGFEIVEQQSRFEWKEHQIRGQIDGNLILGNGHGDGPRRMIPIDIKSCSSSNYRSVNTIDDLRHHKQHYVRSWYSQLTLYCLLGERETGLLVLKDKATGLLKQVAIPLDYQHAEELTQKADHVNANVAAGTLPPRIPYDDNICGRCGFNAICLPDQYAREGARLIVDPGTEEKLARRSALRAAAEEYARLDREIKGMTQGWGDGETIIGVDWLIRTKTIARRGYEVKPTRYQVVEIHNLSAKREAADGTP